MIHSFHITLIQLYPFPEPVFSPAALRRVGNWERVLNWRTQSHEPQLREIFARRDTLRTWIRNGNPIEVPNLGLLKALRKPDLPYDRFYRPFFQLNEAGVDLGLRQVDGPMPFFPLQILLSSSTPEANPRSGAELRQEEEDSAALERLLGQSLQSWNLYPMLMVYPAGCISAQYRLSFATKEPLDQERLRRLLQAQKEKGRTVYLPLPWQLRYKQMGREESGNFASTLLDSLVQRFYSEIVERDTALVHTPLQFLLVNLQGSLQDEQSGGRHKQAQEWMIAGAGVSRNEVEGAAPPAVVWGDRFSEAEPWLIVGRQRAALAVDDAVRQHIRSYRQDEAILEGRRALRNRTISTLEMAMATFVLYRTLGEWLEAIVREWDLEPLAPLPERLAKFLQSTPLTKRIFGTLYYEVALIHDHLLQADPKNRALWSALYLKLLNEIGDQVGVNTQTLIQHVHDQGQRLYEVTRQRQDFQFNRVASGLEMIANLAGLLGQMGGAVPLVAPTQPASGTPVIP